jgi:opacity protein-like surface antigen
MNKLLVASAAALLLGTFAASANDSYVSVLGGGSWSPDINVAGTKKPMDTGFNVGGRYGYFLDSKDMFSIEADGLFGQSNFTGTNAGRIQSSSYMANIVYHMPFDNTPFAIYGGAGAGAVQTNFDNNLGNHGGSTVLGWQALGGVDYRLNEDVGLFAEYRYQNAHDVNAGGLTNIGNTTNNLSVGVKWHL